MKSQVEAVVKDAQRDGVIDGDAVASFDRLYVNSVHPRRDSQAPCRAINVLLDLLLILMFDDGVVGFAPYGVLQLVVVDEGGIRSEQK